MMELKAHYEEKIAALNSEEKKLPQQNNEVISKIQALKSSLVGGECANNTQLKEKRRRKKMAAERRMMEISNAINSVEQTEARDILQVHYTDIQQELKLKTDALKSISRKVIVSCRFYRFYFHSMLHVSKNNLIGLPFVFSFIPCPSFFNRLMPWSVK